MVYSADVAWEYEELRDAWHGMRDHLASLATKLLVDNDAPALRAAIPLPLWRDTRRHIPSECYAGDYLAVDANHWPWGLRRVVPESSIYAKPLGELKDVLDKLQDSIAAWDVPATIQLVADVQRACGRSRIVVHESRWRAIDRDLRTIALFEDMFLYEATQPRFILPKLIVPAHKYLSDIIAREPQLLFGLTGRQFEELMAEIFDRHGFIVELTQQTRDGGRDIIAIRRDLDIPLKFIVECKRYAPERKVSLGIVQRLYGVKMSEGASKAILATTSTFTSPAVKFAEAHIWDLDLKGHDAIIRWLRETGAA